MTRIGIISDTHGFLDTKVFKYFEAVDEIWHAGDIGDVQVLSDLKLFKPTIAVFGNIDGGEIRNQTREFEIQVRSGLKIMMVHIAGKPPRYNPKVLDYVSTDKPQMLICGHSHILKVMPDKVNQHLHVNPGAAGKHGFHKVRTLIRLGIDNGKIVNPEVIELGPRAKI